MISEMLSPCWPRPPISRLATRSATAAGRRVITGERRSEDHEQEHDDEEDREVLHGVPRRARLLLIGDVRRHRTCDVQCQSGGRSHLLEARLDAVDQLRLADDVGLVDLCVEEDLRSPVVGGEADQSCAEHFRDRSERRQLTVERREIRSGEATVRSRRDDEHRAVVRLVAEDRDPEVRGEVALRVRR